MNSSAPLLSLCSWNNFCANLLFVRKCYAEKQAAWTSKLKADQFSKNNKLAIDHWGPLSSCPVRSIHHSRFILIL